MCFQDVHLGGSFWQPGHRCSSIRHEKLHATLELSGEDDEVRLPGRSVEIDQIPGGRCPVNHTEPSHDISLASLQEPMTPITATHTATG